MQSARGDRPRESGPEDAGAKQCSLPTIPQHHLNRVHFIDDPYRNTGYDVAN
jgi:hypothetical protein